MVGEEEQGDKGKKKRERRGKRVKHNCKHTEWEDKTIGMRAQKNRNGRAKKHKWKG